MASTQKSGRPTRAASVPWTVRGETEGLEPDRGAVEMGAPYFTFTEKVAFPPGVTVTEPLLGLKTSWKVAIS